jgi:DNA processing protein
MFSNQAYLYSLCLIQGLGPRTIYQLLEQNAFSPHGAWEQLRSHPRFSSQVKRININNVWEGFLQESQQFTSILDEDYPALLKQIPDPPLFLFYQGILPQVPGIAIVGSRKMSAYGSKSIEYLLQDLAKQQVPLVSGLAYGVDAETHRFALKQNCPTVAVLGSSLDLIRPVHHDLLAQEIVDEGGCLISEFKKGTDASKGTFPRRNRIIAGLCPVTLVIEAGEKSGALITARFALDYNREVCTIPGSLFSEVSRGCHALLKQGAILIESPKQLSDLYQSCTKRVETELKLTTEQELIYSQLTESPITLDLLASNYHGHSAELFAILAELELARLIRLKPGEGYVRV